MAGLSTFQSGPKGSRWAQKGSEWPQCKKRLITRSPMCGLHVETQNIPLGIKIWPQPMKNVKIGQNSIQKMAVNGSERSIWLILVPEMTRWNFHENRILGSAKTNLPSFLWPAEWKVPAPWAPHPCHHSRVYPSWVCTSRGPLQLSLVLFYFLKNNIFFMGTAPNFRLFHLLYSEIKSFV